MKDFDNEPSRGRIRGVLAWSALFGTLLFSGLHITIMQPYAVAHDGDCLYEIRPTGWNSEEVLPCGSLLTRFSISEEVYLAER